MVTSCRAHIPTREIFREDNGNYELMESTLGGKNTVEDCRSANGRETPVVWRSLSMKTWAIIDKDAPVVRSIRKTNLAVRVRDYLVEKQIYLRSWYNAYAYDAPIEPLRIYHVDPTKITQAMEPFDGPKRVIAGKVLGGTWDEETRPFSELDGENHLAVYESFRDRFENDVPWEETPFYEALTREVRTGRGRWGCRSKDDVRSRCRAMDELYRTIESDGYRTQRELADSADSANERGRREIWRIINNEIAINVGRSGELIFYDGRHRLAIAKILGLKSIPVVILLRHESWQRTRDRVVRGETDAADLATSLRTHPDMVDSL